MSNETQARALLDRLIELDFQTVEAYFDMGSIISSMQHGKLYNLIGYDSMGELIEEELTYTASTGLKYAGMYRNFRRLGYLKHEAVGLLKHFGLTHMVKVLPSMDSKIGQRAISARIQKLDEHQMGFTLNSKELDRAHKALILMGAVQTDEGRFVNSSQALMQMVDHVLSATNKKAA